MPAIEKEAFPGDARLDRSGMAQANRAIPMTSTTATADDTAAAQYRLGLLLVTLSTVAWSTAGFFARLIPLDAWTILFWRGIFGALAGLAFILWQERGHTWHAFASIRGRGIVFCLLSTAGMITFLGALKTTTVAHVSIIYATVPFMAAGLAWAVLRERVTRATLVASLIAVAGVAFAMGGALDEGTLLGDGLSVLLTMLMAMMIVLQRMKGEVDMVPAACLSALVTALVSLPFATPLNVTTVDMVNLALFGISNMGLGLILFTIGSRLIPAANTALIGALDAPLAPVWVWLAFAETPGINTVLGGVVVMAAVIGHILFERRQAARTVAPPTP